MANFTELKAYIRSYIYENHLNDITGEELQGVLIEMVEKMGDEAINEIAQDIADEITARQNAVSAEAEARALADTQLDQKIYAEGQARIAAVHGLEQAIQTEQSVRSTEILSLNTFLNSGYLFIGVAATNTNPGMPDRNIFYLTSQTGTFTNFKDSENQPISFETSGIRILYFSTDDAWQYSNIILIEDKPNANSSSLVKSGGVDAAIRSMVGYLVCTTAGATAAKTITGSFYILQQGGSLKVKFTNKNTADDATLKIGDAEAQPLYYAGRRAGSSNSWEAGEVVEIFYDGTNYYANNVMGGGAGDGAFDISVYNAVEGTPTKYADLAAALGTNGANIPQSLRKGGMSVKYVQTSDNKYVQFRYMGTSTDVADFTDVANWQGVDNEPTAGSENLVKSGGVYDETIPLFGLGKNSNMSYVAKEWLDGTDKIVSSANANFVRIKVNGGERLKIKRLTNDKACYCMIVKDYDPSHALPYTPTFATGITGRISNDVELILPSDATDILIATNNNATGADCLPGTLIIDDFDYINGVIGGKVGFAAINGLKIVSNFRGKKISIIGDSVSTFDAEGFKIDGYRMYYPHGNVTDVNQTYWKKLIDICGGQLEVNASWSGSCSSNIRSSETYEGQNFPDFYDRCTLLGNPDVIIIELGQNDSANSVPLGFYDYESAIENLDESKFITSYIKGVKKLQVLYPNAVIFCITTSFSSVNYKNAIKNIADRLGCNYIDVSGYDDTTMTSGHPSAEGMISVANKISIFNEQIVLNEKSISIINGKQKDIENVSVTFEQGSISGNTETSVSSRIRSGFIEVDGFISASVDNNHVLWAVKYDGSKSFLGYTSATKNNVDRSELDESVKYLRFLIGNADKPYMPAQPLDTIITPSDVTGFSMLCNISIKNIGKELQSLKENILQPIIEGAEYLHGYINGSGDFIKYAPAATYTWDSWKINGLLVSDINFRVYNSLNPTQYPYYAIGFYNSNDVFNSTTFISGVKFGSYQTGTLSDNISVPEGCKAVLVCTRNTDTPANGVLINGSSSIEGELTQFKNIDDRLKTEEEHIQNEGYDSVGNAEFWLDLITGAYSDMTWVGNRLIGFSGSSDDLTTSAGHIYINVYANGVDKQRTENYELQHFWGHCNTIDYRPEIDCLILGNGSGDYALAGKIIVIPNFSQIVGVSASSSTPLTLSDVNALIIDCASYDLGSKFNLVWGDDNDKNYNIAYLMTANIDGSTSANGGDLETIRKIVLRKGEEQGTYGIIVVNNTPFNGTFDIVETYHQITAGYPNCDQGTCYHNGELYACIGHDGAWYWRMRLAGGQVFKKDYKQQTYYANKPINFGNASGICFKDGYMFIGRSGLGIMALAI